MDFELLDRIFNVIEVAAITAFLYVVLLRYLRSLK